MRKVATNTTSPNREGKTPRAQRDFLLSKYWENILTLALIRPGRSNLMLLVCKESNCHSNIKDKLCKSHIGLGIYPCFHRLVQLYYTNVNWY